MPNSYVNDDGKPNLNNSNAENDNDARVSLQPVRCGMGMRDCVVGLVYFDNEIIKSGQPPVIFGYFFSEQKKYSGAPRRWASKSYYLR